MKIHICKEVSIDKFIKDIHDNLWTENTVIPEGRRTLTLYAHNCGAEVMSMLHRYLKKHCIPIEYYLTIEMLEEGCAISIVLNYPPNNIQII